uniref:Uncharacterized protein n=1 Tax=Sphaerodactylus townsendi TaxID=933632 RepID=A0ACB8EA86_9SAUR
MPHFTVVPVEQQQEPPSGYDALEGLSWVDYSSQPGGAPRRGSQLRQRDADDTVSSDDFYVESLYFFITEHRQVLPLRKQWK